MVKKDIMNIIKTEIPDVLIFEPKVFGDHRGYFFESFRQDVFEKAVGKNSICSGQSIQIIVWSIKRAALSASALFTIEIGALPTRRSFGCCSRFTN